MFSPALGRAIRSTCTISGTAICTANRPAAVTSIGAASQSLSRRPHQRRHSSSKASVPPNGSNGSSSPHQTSSTALGRSPEKKPAGRGGRKRAVSSLNVPHVPPTDHLDKSDVNISSFFSLHRPISVTTSLPLPCTEASFNAIFEPRVVNNRSKYADVINTLSNSVENLDVASQGHEGRDIREEILHNSLSNAEHIRHLDGVPQISVDQMVAQFIPFRPPPPPVPFDETQARRKVGTSKSRSREAARVESSQPKQKAWSTTVVVTESTDSNGERTYSASTSPMVEIQIPTEKNPVEPHEIEIRQPFLDRMKIRQRRYEQYRDERADKDRSNMLLISVKRQRKLKMKKHKYKKLMKRTRILRRKLDRA
ncbi:hypothetical protein K432DRAFT_361928 [Lepidopterella palustris CBS 459.81]|uniref:Small ribosomal subunit protein mS38 n=1 Tax=Lepidopterella palustris CBS 459.81 TaxID=1314670 RepID=A0A8E2E187_9PEZI|nr:hypothetical protein K432DRAFT_361928 [Lepidopterella palustris CBS 459.81]